MKIIIFRLSALEYGKMLQGEYKVPVHMSKEGYRLDQQSK